MPMLSAVILHDLVKALNIFGSLYSLVAALLIFNYGLPPQISASGKIHLVLEEIDEEEARLAFKYQCYSSFGLGLLFAGFLLQFVAALWS